MLFEILRRRRWHQYADLSPILIVMELTLCFLDHGRGQSPCFGVEHILIEQPRVVGIEAARLDLLDDEGMEMADQRSPHAVPNLQLVLSIGAVDIHVSPPIDGGRPIRPPTISASLSHPRVGAEHRMRPAGPVSGINDVARWRNRMLHAGGCASKGERCCTASIEGRPVAALKGT